MKATSARLGACASLGMTGVDAGCRYSTLRLLPHQARQPDRAAGGQPEDAETQDKKREAGSTADIGGPIRRVSRDLRCVIVSQCVADDDSIALLRQPATGRPAGVAVGVSQALRTCGNGPAV